MRRSLSNFIGLTEICLKRFWQWSLHWLKRKTHNYVSLWSMRMRIFIDCWADSSDRARTLWVIVYLWRKLFNVLNILSYQLAWRKSQKRSPHTWGNSLRQQSLVPLSSADSSSVRRALMGHKWKFFMIIIVWQHSRICFSSGVAYRYLQ